MANSPATTAAWTPRAFQNSRAFTNVILDSPVGRLAQLVERAPYKREGACSSQAPPILRRSREAARGRNSVIEDLGSGLLTLFAFVVPVLAILLVIALLAALAVLWWRALRGMGALG